MRVLKLILISFFLRGYCEAEPLVPESYIAIFSQGNAAELVRTVCEHPPVSKDAWNPTTSDLQGLDSDLIAFLKSKGAPTNVDWLGYRAQVAGLVCDGEQYLFLYYFRFYAEEEEQRKARDSKFDPDAWRKRPYKVYDGGRSFFRVLYDIKNKRFVWYECNGIA